MVWYNRTCSWVGEEILGSKQLKKPIFVGIYWTPKSLEFFSPIARAVWHGRLKKFRFRLCAPNLSVSLPIYRQNTRILTMNTLKFQIKDTALKKFTWLKKGIHVWARVTALRPMPRGNRYLNQASNLDIGKNSRWKKFKTQGKN